MPNIFLDNWLKPEIFFLSFHQAYGSFSNGTSSNAKYSLTSFPAVDGLAKASNNLFFRCCTGGGETLDKLYRLTGYIRRIRLD